MTNVENTPVLFSAQWSWGKSGLWKQLENLVSFAAERVVNQKGTVKKGWSCSDSE